MLLFFDQFVNCPLGNHSPPLGAILNKSTKRDQMSKPFIVSTFSTYISKEFFYYFADTYEEAFETAEYFYLQTGKVVAVERVAQDPTILPLEGYD